MSVATGMPFWFTFSAASHSSAAKTAAVAAFNYASQNHHMLELGRNLVVLNLVSIRCLSFLYCQYNHAGCTLQNSNILKGIVHNWGFVYLL